MEEVFAGRHFDREAIILCVRWYLLFKLSYRDLAEMMAERRLNLAQDTCGGPVGSWNAGISPVYPVASGLDNDPWTSCAAAGVGCGPNRSPQSVRLSVANILGSALLSGNARSIIIQLSRHK